MKPITATRLFILAAGMLLAACKKEYSNNPPPVPAETRFESRLGEDGYISFEYNTDGTVKKASVASEASPGDTIRYSISYAADKRISKIVNDAAVQFVPVYTNGELSRVVIKTAGNDELAYTDYEYLNGFLKSATVFFLSGNQVIPFFKNNFLYDASGNISRSQLLGADPSAPGGLTPEGSTSYLYDNKTNPLYAASEFLRMILIMPSPNNTTKEEAADKNNQPEKMKEYNYIYNNKNLPQSAVLTETIPGKPIQTKNISYHYQ